MKRHCIIAVVLSLCLCLFGTVAWANFTSTFDSNAEGWTINSSATGIWYSSGSGGYIGLTEDVHNIFYHVYAAPDTWDGNWTLNTNQAITFDASWFATEYFGVPEVIVNISSDTGGSMHSGQYYSMGGWNTLTFNLDSTLFTIDSGSFTNILADVDSFKIFIERPGGQDVSYYSITTAIDNVSIPYAPTTAPVPIPPAILLLGSGLIGIWGVRRKHSSRRA